MDLKKLLKQLKLNENGISIFLGLVIILVLGYLFIKYISKENGEVIPPIEINQNQGQTHTVAEGENLWTISEIYYGNGYNWVDIAKENNIQNPNQITEGQSLLIPNIENKIVKTSPTISSLGSNNNISDTIPENISDSNTNNLQNTLEGNVYTVIRGDNLWNIAVKAYGDGYRWVEIAKENKLKNPNIIHAGNELILPK